MIGSNYRVVRCIGRGGMGEVYEVEHVGLGVRYALKTFAYDGEDFGEMLKTKFLEEGQMLARLKHPHLIRVFDLAMDESAKVLYYVMDLVLYKDGNPYSLDDVDRNDLDEDFVYDWFCDVCDALDYIHGMGVVHRDIKEANLLLTADKHVMLSDFGISHIFGNKLVKGGNAQKTLPHSAEGEHTVLGTEHYMAPEVEAGDDPTPAADAYSLGVTIFRLLTGVWYAPDTDVLSLLKGRKYRWSVVLPRLLAKEPTARPQKLADAAKLLKEKPRETTHKETESFGVFRWGVIVSVLALVVVGVIAIAHRRVRTAEERIGQTEEERAVLESEREAERRQREALEAQLARERAERDRQREEETRREAERKKAEDEKQRAEVERKREAEEMRRQQEEAKRKAEAERLRKEAERAKHAAEGAARPKIEEAPAVAYRWYTDDSRHAPSEVKVEWANGASCRSLPLVCGGRTFWMGRYPITVAEWREFKPGAFADLNKVESSLPLEYGLCPKLTTAQASELAAFLTAKYRKCLPSGFEVRLPTKDELDAAIAQQATESRCERTGRDMKECVALGGAVRRARFAKLQGAASLNQQGQWSAFGVNEDGIMIAGLSMPHATGVCDLGDSSYPHLVIARQDQ